jgi:hypothetical protein
MDLFSKAPTTERGKENSLLHSYIFLENLTRVDKNGCELVYIVIEA